jgi:hypothetical protein
MAERCVLLAAWALLLVGFAAAMATKTMTFDFNKGFSGKPEDQALSVPSMTDLEFTWAGGHNVYLMKDKAAFDACKFDTATKLADKSGYKHHVMGKNGDVLYFACQVGSHCSSGQKLAVTITDAAGGTTKTAGAMSVRVIAVFQCGCIRSPVTNVLPREWRAVMCLCVCVVRVHTHTHTHKHTHTHTHMHIHMHIHRQQGPGSQPFLYWPSLCALSECRDATAELMRRGNIDRAHRLMSAIRV